MSESRIPGELVSAHNYTDRLASRCVKLRKEREMATRKKTTTRKGEVKKQKSRKATIKDLDVKGIRGGSVKGGAIYVEKVGSD